MPLEGTKNVITFLFAAAETALPLRGEDYSDPRLH
jgi:hypothetical protein